VQDVQLKRNLLIL